MNIPYITPFLSKILNFFLALKPGEKISTLAFIVSIFTFFITSLINRKNSFDNLFFHLISLLSDILKLDKYSSKEITTTFTTISSASTEIIKSRNNEIKEKTYKLHEIFVKDSFIELQNLHLEWFKEAFPATINTDQKNVIPVRKYKYLQKVNSLQDIFNYAKHADKYYEYKPTETFLEQFYPDYEYVETPDTIVELIFDEVAFESDPCQSIFTLINDPQKKERFLFLLEHLSCLLPKRRQEIDRIRDDFFNFFDLTTLKIPYTLVDKDKKLIVSLALNSKQYEVFFRTSHRVLKIILAFSFPYYFIGMHRTIINKYCGIFRTQLSEQQLLLLFYNAEFSKRGVKFKKIVEKTNLFGDISELPLSKDDEPTHFQRKILIWEDSDMKNLRNDYVAKNFSYFINKIFIRTI